MAHRDPKIPARSIRSYLGMKSSLLKNLALVLASVTISLLLAELVLRSIYPTDSGTPKKYRIPHPVFGWTLEPNTSYLNRLPEAAITVEYNSSGWRDTEHDIAKPDHKFRILVLGDSFMEAYSVGLRDAFFKQLETLAREQGLDLEVINFGVGGYGTLQEYLVFDEIGKQYKPDLVLLGFYVNNDVRNNSYQLETSLSVNRGRMKTDSRPFLDLAAMPAWKVTMVDYEGAHRRYLKARAKFDSFSQTLKRNSALLQSLSHARDRIKSALSTDRTEKSQSDEKQLARNGVHYCEEPEAFTQAWTVTEAVLAKLKQEIDSTNSKLFVFSVPAVQEVDPAVMQAVTEEMTSPATLCLEEAPGHKRLNNLLTKLRIDHLDLLPYFRQATRAEGMSLFRQSDDHWNEKGHRLAANIVLDELMEKGYLAGPRDLQ